MPEGALQFPATTIMITRPTEADRAVDNSPAMLLQCEQSAGCSDALVVGMRRDMEDGRHGDGSTTPGTGEMRSSQYLGDVDDARSVRSL